MLAILLFIVLVFSADDAIVHTEGAKLQPVMVRTFDGKALDHLAENLLTSRRGEAKFVYHNNVWAMSNADTREDR